MVDPRYMCDRHLLGEHVECHMFAGCLERDKSVSGYIRNNLFDAASLTKRHDRIAREMKLRGFSHRSKIARYKGRSTPINVTSSFNDLMYRCPRCRERYELHSKSLQSIE
ncbi:MAG: hypothetical protein JXA01_02960 [Dehalococcoidia bacterium]|nr:hypothetical protein [Dehalococcoidia bacterium]